MPGLETRPRKRRRKTADEGHVPEAERTAQPRDETAAEVYDPFL